MPTVKKQAYDRIVAHLERELQNINFDIQKNRRQFRALEKEQEVLKRMREPIVTLIRDIKNKT